jgi:glycosyltransferase involved in cell wall biosynthesis
VPAHPEPGKVPLENNVRRLCFPYTGDSLGGSHISSLLLVRKLLDEGHMVTVALHQSGIVSEECQRVGVESCTLNLRVALGRDSRRLYLIRDFLTTFYKIWRFLGRVRPEVVHTNDMRTHLFWTIPARARGIPTVWHQRTVFPQSQIAQMISIFATSCVVISKVVQKTLPKNMQAKSLVIPNPVAETRPSASDISHALTIIKKTASSDIDISKRTIVGFFGALRDLKRPMIFVDAIATLAAWGEGEFVGVMFGKDQENLGGKITRRASERGISEQIVLMGFHNSIEALMSACDVVVSTSTGDAFGRTLIEGMALGVPVIAVDAGGHPEVICDGVDGVLAEPDDPVSVARAVQAVVRDQALRDRLIRGGRNSARTKFSIGRHVEKITRLYQSTVLGNR